MHTSAISLADALYGKLLGLNAFQNTGFSGEEGRGATFNIRGVQTTGERDILILVDGVERPIDRITVEEVESVTVLKDAAAVALYGHEAINGVLLVKTKHGNKDGKYHFKVVLLTNSSSILRWQTWSMPTTMPTLSTVLV